MRLVEALVAVCVLTGSGTVARAADCIVPDDTATQTETTDAAITMCFDAGGCWGFTIATRAWARHAPLHPATPTPPAPADPKVAANIHVCAPDGTDCQTINLPGARTINNLEALQTPTRVAILGQGSSVYLYDRATRKLVATIPAWKSHYEADVIQSGNFIDGNLVIYESSSPITDEVRLFDGATGKQLAIIDPAVSSEPIGLADGDWAFWHIESDTLVIANAWTGKLRKSIPLTGPSAKVGGGGSLLTYRTTDRKLFLAARGDAASGIVVYDLATKSQARYLPPVCKP